MSIRLMQKPDGRWLCDIRTIDEHRKPLRERPTAPEWVRTEAAAQKWAESRLRVLSREGPASKAKGEALEQVAKKWIEHLSAEQRSPSTIDDYRSRLRIWIYPTLGKDLPISAVDKRAIHDLRQALAGRSAKTANNVLAVLGGLLNFALEHEMIAERPRVSLLKTQKPPPKYYEVDTYEKLVEGARKSRIRGALALVLLAGDAGLRRGEIMALRWTDVEAGHIMVQRSMYRSKPKNTKGKRFRSVYMTERLAEAITQLPRTSEYVLQSELGRILTPRAMRNWVRSAERHAGLPLTGRLHIFRHTFASHLVWANVDLYRVGGLLGHADTRTTQIYAHLAERAQKEAVEALENIRGKSEARKTKTSK